MIISHKHKFIFIKPHKTAGTSVELLLSRICGPEDVITPLGFDPEPNVRQKHQAKDPQNYKRPKLFKYWEMRELAWIFTQRTWPNLNYREHLNAQQAREYVGERIWGDYLKISIVRNPWDHAISQFEWMKKYGYGGVKNDFVDFLKYRYHLQWPFFSSHGEYDIDHIIRFETVEEDLKILITRLDPSLQVSVPRTKDRVRTERGYHKYYDDKTAEIVRFKNLQIIELFQYQF